MTRSGATSLSLSELMGAAFWTPLFSLLLAVVVCGFLLIALSRPGRAERRAAPLSDGAAMSVRARYRPAQRTLGIVAIVVTVLFIAEHLIRGYVLDVAAVVAWWRVAAVLWFALLGLGVVLGMILRRRTASSEQPVVPAARRTWTTFGPRRGLLLAGAVALILLVTTVVAGLASSPDREGQYAGLDIPIPNKPEIDPIRVPFFGWAYGVPVIIGLTALALVTWAVLHVNAARPYIRPETVAAERLLRREIAGDAVGIMIAGMLLATASAWRFVARAGSVSSLEIMGENDGSPYDATWRYAEAALAAGWAAPILEISAFVLLMLVASRLRRRDGASAGSADRAPDAAVTR
ncbi:hypothetical protein [Microbacterium oxydans]|uniref:Uncharacterized protein n=1 Tax=Microbacterium oxydans TaxID=82380 RepID=A0A0F0LA44_9MICO|nr:hypothetical protein [Microbacterium oxydans]KJL30067.1 hypothetical protein RS83_01209 [Microbacterium oxydans]